MFRFIKELFSCILDTFLPSHCFSCSSEVIGGKIICDKCFADLDRSPKKICIKCGIKSDDCDCKRFVYHFSGVTAPFKNSGAAQKGIYRFKFSNQDLIAKFYADEMADDIKNRFKDINFDFVCAVPMNKFKRMFRNYDHSAILGQAVADNLNLPFKSNVLHRKFLGKIQHKLKNFKERFNNAYLGFYSNKKLDGETVLLIDDIKTSGASLDACARQLLYAGATSVYCAVALMGQKGVEKTDKV